MERKHPLPGDLMRVNTNECDALEPKRSDERFRLGCVQCDRDDFDEVDVLPNSWEDITPVQSLQESKTPGYLVDKTRSPFEWQTHLGLCPECQASRIEKPTKEHRKKPSSHGSNSVQTLLSNLAESGMLSGRELATLMRRNRVTIKMLAARIGTTQKRVRQVRVSGFTDPLSIRDWIQAITGDDPGQVLIRFRVDKRSEDFKCANCGRFLNYGEDVYRFGPGIYCSKHCCRECCNS